MCMDQSYQNAGRSTAQPTKEIIVHSAIRRYESQVLEIFQRFLSLNRCDSLYSHNVNMLTEQLERLEVPPYRTLCTMGFLIPANSPPPSRFVRRGSNRVIVEAKH